MIASRRVPAPGLAAFTLAVLVGMRPIFARGLAATPPHARHRVRLFSSAAGQTSRPSIAIIGGGLAGCAAAQEFARKGYAVDLFETGRGVGGRSSTRRVGDYSFDHGAQYITLPKTGTFQKLLLQSLEFGAVKPWEGNFSIAQYVDGGLVWTGTKGARYVGVPSMSAMCKQMVLNPLITCHFSCPVRAQAEPQRDGGRWRLSSLRGDLLGHFDWLVVGDRAAAANIAQQSSAAFASASLGQLAHALSTLYEPIPCLSLMIALKASIPRSTFPHDSVSVKGSKVLGWISRNTSKPGRARADGHECWNIQSNTEFSKAVIKQVDEEATADGQQLSFEERRQRVNLVAAEKLYSAFLGVLVESNPSQKALIHQLLSVSNIAAIEGHRWGAARPRLTEPLVGALDARHYQELGAGLCYVDPAAQLAACGDYMPADERILGIVEGAVSSGHQAARSVVQTLRPAS